MENCEHPIKLLNIEIIMVKLIGFFIHTINITYSISKIAATATLSYH